MELSGYGLNNQFQRVIDPRRPRRNAPALDQYTPRLGRKYSAKRPMRTQRSAPDETEPDFTMPERQAQDSPHTQALLVIADSPQTIDALLSGLFSVAVGAKLEHFVIRGSGAGQPLGILNADSAIPVNTNTGDAFTWPDVANMTSRFKTVGGSGVWLIHPSVWPDILQMEIGTAGASAWVANMQASQGNSINGYPIIMSEHSPQANNAGDVILADLSAYLLFRREALSIAFSDHYGFVNDMGTWRFTARSDGKPWLKNAITLADPTGSYTVSPFVYHND